MWEFDRRGYLQRGSNAPEVVLEHPDLVKAMHREFVHAGSDVVLAFTVSLYCNSFYYVINFWKLSYLENKFKYKMYLL